MKRIIYVLTAAAVLLCILFIVLYVQTGAGCAESCAITFGTCSYHLLMRLAVGFAVNGCMHNRSDLTHAWFQQKQWEPALYKALRVKQWKKHIPTFAPENFSPALHTWDEIAQAMCQSELVHEIIVVLSFLPLAASVLFGAFFVFLLTALAAAGLELMFIITQRYNRPRILRLAGYPHKKGSA